ncbi:supporter of activation of yellow protein-like isoform X2 [Varroa jacobsoni]|uniref:supporter of activation of yellow protein-like isoform X2 n=1 Tax=Varroa jacobsoni TaxID=62625 RepID=UPI000BF27070|nr:supporter of activation of yellow protein-like isoform X2 [Varroa jacobsoni]
MPSPEKSTDKDAMTVDFEHSANEETVTPVKEADSESAVNSVNSVCPIGASAVTTKLTSPDVSRAVRPKCPDSKSKAKSLTSTNNIASNMLADCRKKPPHSKCAVTMHATVAASKQDNAENNSASINNKVGKPATVDSINVVVNNKAEKSVSTSDNNHQDDQVSSSLSPDTNPNSSVEKCITPNSGKVPRKLVSPDLLSGSAEKSQRPAASASHSVSVAKPATSEVAVNTHIKSEVQVNKCSSPENDGEEKSHSYSGTLSVPRSGGYNSVSRVTSDQLVSLQESTSTASHDRLGSHNRQDSVSDKPVVSPDQTLPDTSEITPITPDVPEVTITSTPRSLSCEREPSYQQHVRTRPDTIEVNHATQTDTPEPSIEAATTHDDDNNAPKQIENDTQPEYDRSTHSYEPLPAVHLQQVENSEENPPLHPHQHAMKRPPPPPIPPHPPASIVQRNNQSNGRKQMATIHTVKAVTTSAATAEVGVTTPVSITSSAMIHVTSVTTFRKQPNSVAPVSHPPVPIKHHRRASQGLLPQLTHVDQLLIKQRLPVAELRRNSDFNNKYTLRTILGQDVFRAEEATTLCARDCCGPDRAFHMNIVDLHGRPVIALERPPWLNVCCCCPLLPVCQQETRIEAPPGSVIGVIREEQTWFGVSPRFAVNDLDGKITDPTGMEVGRVSKEWDNLPKELLATSDNFGVAFPEDIPATHKALLIGVAFILDFVYYEREREKYSRTGLAQQIPSVANSRRSSSQHSDTSNEVNENFPAWGGGIETHSRDESGGGD